MTNQRTFTILLIRINEAEITGIAVLFWRCSLLFPPLYGRQRPPFLSLNLLGCSPLRLLFALGPLQVALMHRTRTPENASSHFRMACYDTLQSLRFTNNYSFVNNSDFFISVILVVARVGFLYVKLITLLFRFIKICLTFPSSFENRFPDLEQVTNLGLDTRLQNIIRLPAAHFIQVILLRQAEVLVDDLLFDLLHHRLRISGFWFGYSRQFVLAMQ